MTLEAKIPALAKVLANGIRDEARIDEAITFVKILNEMEAAHLRVLAALFEWYKKRDDPGRGWLDRDGWASRSDLLMITSTKVDDAIMTVLTSNGASIRDTYQMEDIPGRFPMWQITRFGISCLELLGHIPVSNLPEDFILPDG